DMRVPSGTAFMNHTVPGSCVIERGIRHAELIQYIDYIPIPVGPAWLRNSIQGTKFTDKDGCIQPLCHIYPGQQAGLQYIPVIVSCSGGLPVCRQLADPFIGHELSRILDRDIPTSPGSGLQTISC